jgi:hypothetical protein
MAAGTGFDTGIAADTDYFVGIDIVPDIVAAPADTDTVPDIATVHADTGHYTVAVMGADSVNNSVADSYIDSVNYLVDSSFPPYYW